MTNKEAYTKLSEKVIALLAEADSLMSNASADFNPRTEDALEYEYFIQKQLFHGTVKSALIANSEIQSHGGSVTYMPLKLD